MKQTLFALTALPMLAWGAQSTPVGAYLTVEQTCAFVQDTPAGRLIGCNKEEPVTLDCGDDACVIDGLPLPVQVRHKAEWKPGDTESFKFDCDQGICHTELRGLSARSPSATLATLDLAPMDSR